LRKLQWHRRVVKSNLNGGFFEETPVSLRLTEVTVITSYNASRTGIAECHHVTHTHTHTHKEAETAEAMVCNFALSGKRTDVRFLLTRSDGHNPT